MRIGAIGRRVVACRALLPLNRETGVATCVGGGRTTRRR